MRVNRYILAVGLLLAGSLAWWIWPSRQSSAETPADALLLGPRAKGSGVAWTKPEESWIHRDVYSDTYNQDMAQLLNNVRQRQSWGTDEGNFIAYCLSDLPTFTGADWTQADLSENERAQKFMQAAGIFSDHLLRGGEINNSSLEELKDILVARLEHPVPFVRGSAVVALAESNYLGDAKVQAQVEAMAKDPDTYVRSVVKTQIDNRLNRLKGAR